MAFWRLQYHLVWATKNREPYITSEVETELFGYMVKKAKELKVIVHAINGWTDHVHVVASIPPKYAVAEVVKRLKGASSHHLNHHSFSLNYTFGWQRGYGALSLGENQKAIAIAYVEKQKEHHQQLTTNYWLEKITELDEGPEECEENNLSVVRETSSVYVVSDKPF